MAEAAPVVALWAAVTASSGSASEIELTAQVDRPVVALDETVQLTVSVSWDGPADRYRFGWPETPQTYRLNIVGSRRGSKSWAADSGQRSLQQFSFLLRPQELGSASIGAVRLTYWDTADTSHAGRTLLTAPIRLTVEPPRRTGSGRIWREALVTLGAVGLVLAGAWRFRLWRARRNKPPEAPAPPNDELSEHLAALARSRSEFDVPAFYGQAHAALRLAIGRAMGESLASLTTSELVARVEKAGWPADAVSALVRTLLKIDRRRFAPSRPEEWDLADDEATIRKLCYLVWDISGPPPRPAEERNGDR